jgi:hypothetical protein
VKVFTAMTVGACFQPLTLSALIYLYLGPHIKYTIARMLEFAAGANIACTRGISMR